MDNECCIQVDIEQADIWFDTATMYNLVSEYGSDVQTSYETGRQNNSNTQELSCGYHWPMDETAIWFEQYEQFEVHSKVDNEAPVELLAQPRLMRKERCLMLM